jgi:ABC-2 type transport system ATP-binding protein
VLIELDNVGKRYGAVRALAGITGTIDGKIIGLLGPNGAGKSTLLKCLLGLTPHEGQARVLGLRSTADSFRIRDRVGYMPESDVFLGGMTAVGLCVYAAELSGLPYNEAMQRAHAALYYAGIEDKRYQKVEDFSTGLKQRVKLAQALVHDPELLFLDEPTNGLDPTAREEMLELVTELPTRRGCAIVLSTHLLPDVERLCDNVVIMHRGRLRYTGTVAALRRAGGSAYEVEVRDQAAPLLERLRAAGMAAEQAGPQTLHLVLDGDAEIRRLFTEVRAAGAQLRGLAERRETLEAAFLRVVGEPDSGAPAGAAGAGAAPAMQEAR